jgi:L-gulono-1,4-lactone dehydrogenase
MARMGCLADVMALRSAALVAALVLAGGCGSWTNWSGNVRCHPRRIVRPSDLAQLRIAVRGAQRLRLVGAGHSWSALSCTSEVLVDTRRLSRVLAIDPAARRITVEAGITLKALDEAVAKHGLALATEPTVEEITAAGAIATASHGTGLGLGAMSEEVVALEVLDGNGETVRIDDPDRLRAARVGLGALGVIYAVTFRLVPAFKLEMVERLVDEHEAFDRLDALVAEHQHVDLFWFQTERKVFLRTYDRTDKPLRTHDARDWIEEMVVKTWIGQFGLAIAARAHPLAKLLNRVSPALFRDRTTVDRSDKILHRYPGHQKVFSMEYLVPLARTREALGAIRDALSETRFFPNMPFYLRFIGGAGGGEGGADLSPMRGGPRCAVEVLSYVGFTGWERFFRVLEPRFRALGGRPHWGKLFFANPRDLYEPAAWAHVEKVRAELDPTHKLSNDLTRTLFAP